MANTSILAAFERMWQHTVAALGNKANVDHSHTLEIIFLVKVEKLFRAIGL